MMEFTRQVRFVALLVLMVAPVVAFAGGPDLSSTKTDDVGGQATLNEEFTWTIVIENLADEYTTSFGLPWFVDNLPGTGVTYGALTTTLSGGASGDPACSLNVDPTIGCVGAVTLPTGGKVTLEVPVTPTAVGALTNPRSGGSCLVQFITGDGNPGNDTCSNSVVVSTGATGPDLTVSKSNNVGGATELAAGPFTWTLQVGNGGETSATFTSGQAILRDNLPNSGVVYGTPQITNQSGIMGTIGCAVVGSDLTCSAQGGAVEIAALTGSFTVTVEATPSTAGSLANPRAAGQCAVDPDGVVTEDDESNNACTDTVVVAASPDLTIDKTNSVAGAGTIDQAFNWIVTATNSGSGDAVIPSAFPLLIDALPDQDVNYGPPGVQTTGTVTGSIACAVNASTNLVCTADAGDLTLASGASVVVTVAATPTAVGAFANPRSGGNCAVDPTSSVLETDESNNSCSDTVTVDGGPPQVDLGSVGATPSPDCGSVPPGADQIMLIFSESMADPAGDSGAYDVTNPLNYVLLVPGTDGTFQTDMCGPLAGDDAQLTVSMVSYDDPSTTATLTLAAGMETGLHRLLVCSELEDQVQNPLDGDGDGTGGDDARFSWRIEDSLLVNGNFDCDLAGWDETSTNPNEIVWAADDVGASGDSGSAGIANLTASTDFAISQCVSPMSPGAWQMRAQLQPVSGGGAADVDLVFGCSFHAASDCGGSALANPTDASDVDLVTLGWTEYSGALSAPAGTVAGRCELRLLAPVQDAFEVRLDAVQLIEALVFADGFETGDLTGWSSSAR
jgi:hypothetical protein